MTPRRRTFASSSSRPTAQGARLASAGGLTAAAPGSAWGAGLSPTSKRLTTNSPAVAIDVSEMWTRRGVSPGGTASRPRPQAHELRSFFAFSDPDGNAVAGPGVTTRHPGRT